MTTTQNVRANIDQFPAETSGLPASADTQIAVLSNGDTFGLRIAPVTRRIGDVNVRMLAYNGSIPGPVLKVQQGSEVAVHVINDGDLEATVHWHGLLVENQYDERTRRKYRCRSGPTRPTVSDFSIRASIGITRMFVRTTGRNWACTETS